MTATTHDSDPDSLSRLPRASSGYLVVHDPAIAATALLAGAGIEYCPGDGTRYVCIVTERARSQPSQPTYDPRRWLFVENLDFALILDGAYTLDGWSRVRAIPSGCWSALRPLLKSLGVRAPGSVTFVKRDAEDEARARLRTADGEPYSTADARLGRIVRRALESEVRG